MQNVIKRFDCLIKDNVQSGLDALKNLIYSNAGYLKLATSYEPDVYQEGYLAQEIEVTPFSKDNALSAQFSLYFSCKPQKYFNEEGTGNITRAGAVVSNLVKIYQKDDEELKTLLANEKAWEYPTGDLFLLFKLYEAEADDEVVFTNLSATTSAGGFIALIEYGGISSDEAEYRGTYSDTDGTVTYPEFGYGDLYEGVYVLAPYSPSAAISGQLTYDGNVQSFSVDLADYSATITNEDAVGAEVDNIVFGIRSPEMNYNGTGVDGYWAIEGRKGGEKRFSAIVKTPMGNKTKAQIQAIDLKYPSTPYTYTTLMYRVAVDNDLNALIDDSINAGELLEIGGDISGICDEYTVTMLKLDVASNKYVGQPLIARTTIRWWKV